MTNMDADGVLVSRKTVRTSRVDLVLEIRRLPGGLLAVDVEADDDEDVLKLVPHFLPKTKHGVKTTATGKRRHRFVYNNLVSK